MFYTYFNKRFIHEYDGSLIFRDGNDIIIYYVCKRRIQQHDPYEKVNTFSVLQESILQNFKHKNINYAVMGLNGYEKSKGVYTQQWRLT